MGSYIPSTKSEREEMLKAIGVPSVNALFASVPKDMFLSRDLKLPAGLSELCVSDKMQKISEKNKVFPTVFRGAGAYKHYIPAAVKYIPAKEEFLTAYTPYQAEISQGILQAIFEYQTMVCELTGMDVSNASVYDGATAAAEATSMCREKKRVKTFISATAHPDTIEVVRTYCIALDEELIVVPEKDGVTDMAALKSMLDETAASFYVQQPNYYGLFEDGEALGNIVHEAGAKYIMGCNPIALGMMKTPRECGADIAVAEGQPLGMAMAFGGPYLGIMTCTDKMIRKMPGRIAGETVDAEGNRCYVLTLQAREQHIRREKSSSNICSNQALCALTASVYLSTMGPDGLAQVAELCMSKAHYAADEISKVPGFGLVHKGEFFHEFVTHCPISACKVMEALEAKGILGGLPISDKEILWCVTETNTKEEIDLLVKTLKEVAK